MNGKDIISQIHQYLTGFRAPPNGEQKLPSSTINYPLLLLGGVVPSAAKKHAIFTHRENSTTFSPAGSPIMDRNLRSQRFKARVFSRS